MSLSEYETNEAMHMVKLIDAALQIIADPPVSKVNQEDGHVTIEFLLNGKPFWIIVGEGKQRELK